MQEQVEQLIGKSFEYSSKLYFCRNAKVVSGMAVLITDRQTFNFYKTEFAEFLEEIVFIASKDLKSNSNVIVSEVKNNEAAIKKQEQNEIITASVVKNFSMNETITDKLMAVFSEIDENPTEDVLKKASAMVMASNAIVSVQAAQYKLLNIRK